MKNETKARIVKVYPPIYGILRVLFDGVVRGVRGQRARRRNLSPSVNNYRPGTGV